MTRDLLRRLDRAQARLAPAPDAALALARRVAARALEYEGAVEAAAPFVEWMQRVSGGENLTNRERLERFPRWLEADPAGRELMAPIAPFMDRAFAEVRGW